MFERLRGQRPWRQDRDPMTALAHTREEGGTFWKGGAEHGEFHSAIFEDGWVYDTRLAELGYNEGWRRARYPVEDIKKIWQDPAEHENVYAFQRAREKDNHAASSSSYD